MAKLPIRELVMNHFTRCVGEEVSVASLVKATGATAKQVRTAINGIRSDHGFKRIDFPIEIIERGEVWFYDPETKVQVKEYNRNAKGQTEVYEETPAVEAEEASDTPDMFEFVGMTKDGDMVVRDGEGILYKTEQL